MSYITLLTDDSYVYGVVLLLESLKKVKSKYPLIVLVTKNVSQATQEILRQLYINFIIIDNIDIPENIKNHNDSINPIMSSIWINCFAKFKIFDLIEFKKIVFLDADIMVLKNIDHLFTLPHMTAALDGEYFDLWPNWPHFNSGCLVIEPNHDLFLNILNFAHTVNVQDLDYVVADQEILNLYYNNWINKKELQLNKYYNIFAPYIQEKQIEDIKNNCYFIHYTGRKPWAFFIRNGYETYTEYFYEEAKSLISTIGDKINWELVTSKLKSSIYAICKNEKNNLEKWLKCFSKADYVCVLDTGSTDGTWNMLLDYCKQYSNLIISQKIIKPWRFDTARNLSLELIPKDTDIFFMVDLDEIIKGDNWVNEIKRVWDPGFHRGVYAYHRDLDENGNIIKTIPEFRIHSKRWNHYVNIVHEVLVNTFNEKMFLLEECTSINIEVWHYPKKNKQTNYLQLCEQDLEECPNDFSMRLQLAIEYELVENWEKAREHFNIILNNFDKVQWFEVGRCYAGIGYSYYIENNLDKSLNYFREGRLNSPFFSDNYLLAAQIYLDHEDYQRVIELCEDAINYCYSAVWCSTTDIQSYVPYYLLGISYSKLNNFEKAVYYFTLANFLSNNSNDEIKQNLNYAIQNSFQIKKII